MLLGLAVAACGGGGGDDGGDSHDTSVHASTASVDLVVRDADEPAATVAVTFEGAALAVRPPPDVSWPGWLVIDMPPAATSPTDIVLKASGNVSSEPQGVQTTAVRFTTANADGSKPVFTDVTVKLIVPHYVSPQMVAFRAGRDQTAAVDEQQVQLTASGIDWSVISSQTWLKPARTSGSGSSSIGLSVDPAGLAPGLHTAQLTVRDAAHSVDRVVDVQFVVDPHELVVRRHGVALTSIGSYQELSAQIAIADTAGDESGWSAQSNQAWLKLNAATGTTAQALTVTADPAGLAEGMHYARVSVTPTTSGVTGSSSVVVGLYVDRTKTPKGFFSMTPRASQSRVYGYGQMVADPIRPHVYINQSDNRIDVFNIYTGEEVGHVTKAGAGWGTLAMAPDGSTLMAADIANHTLHKIDPVSLSISAPVADARVPTAPDLRMAAQVASGRLLVATTAGDLIDVAAMKRIVDFSADVQISNAGYIAFSNDGHTVAIQDGTLAPHDLYYLSVFRSGTSFGAAIAGSRREDNAARFLTFTADDSAILAGTGDAGWLQPTGTVGTGTLVAGMRGKAALSAHGFYAVAGWDSINRYSASGALEASDVVSRGLVADIAVSGDQRRFLLWVGGVEEISFMDAP